MKEQTPQLAVRISQRFACEEPALATIAPAHEALIKLAPIALGSTGAMPVMIVDFSKGGLGLRLPVFLPQGALLSVAIQVGDESVSAVARVQRAVMVDRTPNYYLGLAFGDSGVGQAFYAAMHAKHASGRTAA